MTITRVAPDSIAASTNLSGAVTAIDEDPDSSGTDWLTATSAVADTACRVTFGAIPTPPGELIPGAAGQEFRLQLRKTAGAPNPTVDVDLYENGSLVTNLLSGTSITSTSEQVVAATWNATSLSGLSGANVECRVVGHAAGSPGATPAWNSAGTLTTNATLAGTRNVNIPSHSSGDLLVLIVLCRNGEADGTVTSLGSGWTQLGGASNMYGSGTARVAIAWKIGDGTETDVSVTTTGGTTSDRILARVHRFTAANGFHSTPVDNVSSAQNGSGTSATMPSVTTSGNNQLALCLVASAANTTIAASTGESGGDWTEPTAESAGTNGSFGIQTAALASAGTISGGTSTLGTTGTWVTIGVSLIPATVGVNTVEVGAIEWNADHATQTTKTASDTLTVSVSEAAAVDPIEGTTPKSASDSLSVGVSEATANLLSVLTLADNPTSGITDTVSAILSSLSRADNPTAAITDAVTQLLVALARADNPTTGITEAKDVLVALSRVDAPAAGIIEGTAAVSAVINRTDAPAVGVTEGVPAVLSSLSRADTPTVGASESTPNVFSTLSRADAPTVGVTDTLNQLLSLLARTDTINVGITDTVSSIAVPLLRADSLVVGLVEVIDADISETILKTSSDSLSISVVEAKQALVLLTRADALTVGATDLVATLLSLLSRSDTLQISAGEAVTSISVSASAFDNLITSIVEARGINVSFAPRIDSLIVGVSESHDVAIGGLILISATDTAALSVAEAKRVMAALQTVTDELGISVGELSEILTLLPAQQRVIFKGSRRAIRFKG